MSCSQNIIDILNDADTILLDYTVETGCSKDDCEIYQRCIDYIGGDDDEDDYNDYESYSDALEVMCGKIDTYLDELHDQLLGTVIGCKIEEGFILEIIEKFLNVYKYDFVDGRKGPFGFGEALYDYFTELRKYIQSRKIDDARRDEMKLKILRLVKDSELSEQYKKHLYIIVEEMFA